MKFLRWMLFAVFLLAAFYDLFTSFAGTAHLLNAQKAGSPLVYGLALVVSLACIAINFATRDVWQKGGVIMIIIWVALMSYDFFTTSIGVGNVIKNGQFFPLTGQPFDGFTRNLPVTLPITFIVVLSPILSAWVLSTRD